MADKFIQWMGDNQYELEKFCGQDLMQDEESPDILLIPTIDGLRPADLGDYIILDQAGFKIIKQEDFRPVNN